MSGEPLITVVGNIGGDPELRFTPSGAAVCNFSVASTPRIKDGDQWKDGSPTWFNCSAWRELGENVAESLVSGTRVIVQGYLSTREYDKTDGTKGRSLDLRVEAIGPELRWASAKVTRAGRTAPGSQPQGGWGQPAAPPAQDPWATRPATTPAAQDPWASASNEEPPF